MTSAEDLKDARAAFLAWDTNKDGVLTEDEITAHMDEICQYFRLERPNVQKMLKGASISGKGKVNYNEFVTAAFDKKRLLCALAISHFSTPTGIQGGSGRSLILTNVQLWLRRLSLGDRIRPQSA